MARNLPPIARYAHPIIETHCHLDYLKAAPLAELLQAARAQGIESIITIGVSPDNLQQVLNISEQYPFVYATLGIHPHEAQHYNDTVQAFIQQQAAHPKVVAIGEIGLDYHYLHSPVAIQQTVFQAQLSVALQCQLPVVIHTRDADDDTQQILSDYAANHPNTERLGVVHSFTSSLELAQACVDMGFYIGFNGIITFNNADNVRRLLQAVPLERILLETDAPFLTPAPYRGQENSPRYLPVIAAKAAQIKGIDVETLLAQAYQNSLQLFGPLANKP